MTGTGRGRSDTDTEIEKHGEAYCDKIGDVETGIKVLGGKMDVLLQLHGADPNKAVHPNPGEKDEDYIKMKLSGRKAWNLIKAVLMLIGTSGVIALVLNGVGVW